MKNETQFTHTILCKTLSTIQSTVYYCAPATAFFRYFEIFCIQSTRIEKISQLLAELNRRCVKMSPIFKEDQIKNALFPMEEENKLRN